MAGPKPKLAKPSALASQIIARWGETPGEISVERLSSELGDVQRYDIVAALKELERAGAGQFTVGRAGQKARFAWARGAARKRQGAEAADAGQRVQPRRGEVRARSSAAARSAKRPNSPRPQPGLGHEADSVLEHVFHLRPDHLVKLRLPSDVASVEVERLCQFLRALPFERSRK